MALPGFQFRSISLPSRLHPIKSPKSWQITNPGPESTPVTLQTIESGLLRLSELHTLLLENEFRHFPGNVEYLEDSLEASIDLLDSCSAIKDSVDTIHENIRSLQSALRRKGCLNLSNIQDDVSSYLRMRKRVHKTLSKTLKKLKNLESRNGTRSINGDQGEFLCLLRFLPRHGISIFRSVVVFLSGSDKPVFRQGSWFRVSRENCDEGDVGRVDSVVRALQGRIRDNCVRVFDVQKELERLDQDMEGIEEVLERSFRLLVRIRVRVLDVIAEV